MLVIVHQSDLVKRSFARRKLLHTTDQSVLAQTRKDALDAHRFLGVELVVAGMGSFRRRNVGVMAVKHHQRVVDVSSARHALRRLIAHVRGEGVCADVHRGERR